MWLDGPAFGGRLPCVLCRHARRRKTREEWARVCGRCRRLTDEELELLYWCQEESVDRVVIAPNIFRHSRRNSRERYRVARSALDAAGLRAGARVLDVGCGIAANADLFGDCRHIGADLDRSRLRRARRTHGLDSFAVQDITQMAWRAAAFDAVVCLEVIEHLAPEARPPLMIELLRVLRPSGILVLSTPNGRLGFWKRVLGATCERSHERELPAEEVVALAAWAGAQVERSVPVANLILPAGRASTLLIHLVADRHRLRNAVARASASVGYETILYTIRR